MEHDSRSTAETPGVDLGRRQFLGVAGSGILLGGFMGSVTPARAAADRSLRWGVVGTGGIANRMAPMLAHAPSAVLAAVSSRKRSTAEEFATMHGVGKAFDNWQTMIEWDGVDAIYVATPTSVREDIAIAAATKGKHVLAEKPFASLDSVQRITRACRDNGVAFMDGTHFVHHPRTRAIREATVESVGWPGTLDSAFQFGLQDRGNIRFDPTLEPMGAIGDAGWYNMRAIVEYLEQDIVLERASCFSRRDEETHAVTSASGVLQFSDGASSTFTCGFDSRALVMDLRLTGASGAIWIEDFVVEKSPASAAYTYRSGGFDETEIVDIPSPLPAAALMFESMADAVADIDRREDWMQASERTQALLDAVWKAALAHDDPTGDG